MNNIVAILISFGKIGLLSLGGGNSMLRLIEAEAVQARHWLRPEEFAQMLGTTFLFPGLTAVKLAALIGYKTAGLLGLIVATLSINLPGLLLSVIGFQLLSSSQSPLIHKIIIAVQYGALALLAAASYSVGQTVLAGYPSWALVALSFLFFLSLVYLQLSPFWGFIGFIGLGFFLVR